MASGSIFLSGGDWLGLVSSTTALSLGTSNFTVEAWVYLTDYSYTNIIISRADSVETAGAGSWYFGMNNLTGEMQFGQSSTDYWSATGPIVPLNQWCHVAYVRNGTTITGWLNGTSSVSQILSVDLNGVGEIRIGRGRGTSTNYFNGYISNLRVVTGSALYTSTFTPPTSSLTTISGTQLLIAKNYEPNITIPDYSSNAFSFVKNGTYKGTNVLSPFTTKASSVDSVSLAQAPKAVLSAFMSPHASKILYLSNSDASIDKSVVRPQEAYDIG